MISTSNRRLFLDEETKFLKEMEERIGQSRRDPEILLSLAEQLARLNYLDRAERVCFDVLTKNDDNPEAYRLFGEICQMKGQFILAQAFFDKAKALSEI